MSRKVFDELPDKVQRELLQYTARYNEWKKMCNLMKRLDKSVKDYMINEKVDLIEGPGFNMSMAHPSRWMLDQSLIENIEQYKVCKKINLLTVNVDASIVGQKRARDGAADNVVDPTTSDVPDIVVDMTMCDVVDGVVDLTTSTPVNE